MENKNLGNNLTAFSFGMSADNYKVTPPSEMSVALLLKEKARDNESKLKPFKPQQAKKQNRYNKK